MQLFPMQEYSILRSPFLRPSSYFSFDRNALTINSDLTQKLSASSVNHWSLRLCCRAGSPVSLQACFLITFVPPPPSLVCVASFAYSAFLVPVSTPFLRCYSLVSTGPALLSHSVAIRWLSWSHVHVPYPCSILPRVHDPKYFFMMRW